MFNKVYHHSFPWNTNRHGYTKQTAHRIVNYMAEIVLPTSPNVLSVKNSFKAVYNTGTPGSMFIFPQTLKGTCGALSVTHTPKKLVRRSVL